MVRNVCLITLVGGVLAFAAEAPYTGTWKMNIAKSNFGEMTVTYEQMAGGEMKATMDGQSYTFKTDGKDNMTPWGITMAWKPVDASTWEVTEKNGSKVTAISTAKLSADGKSLKVDTKRMKADGGSSEDTMTFERVSGGPGLAGKWKAKNLNSSSPESLKLTPKGSDGLTIALGNEGSVCDARLDGKDYPATGPMWPAGWTCVVTKSGENGVALTWKKDGKDMYKSVLTASADGKTLTETGSAVGAKEKFTAVYDKQ